MHMYDSVHTDRHVPVYLLCTDAQQCLVPSVCLHMYMHLQMCTVHGHIHVHVHVHSLHAGA